MKKTKLVLAKNGYDQEKFDLSIYKARSTGCDIK